jgi:hypothetical protein
MQERKKNWAPTSCLQDSPSSFFCPTSRLSQVSEGFFSRRATYKGTYVEAVESARAGLSPKKGDVRRKRKEKKKTKEGGLSPQEGDMRKKKRKRPRKARRWLPRRQGSVCPQPRISFLCSQVLGFGSGPSRLKYQILRDLVYEEAMCEGSSRNGLPYAAKAVP